MHEITVEMSSVPVRFETDSELVAATLQSDDYVRHLVPEMKICDTPADRVARFTQADTPRFHREPGYIHLQGSFDRAHTGHIAHIIRYVAQCQLLEEGQVVIEAAGVADDVSGHLIVGPSKSGKTALASRLQDAYVSVADDQVAISKMHPLLLMSGNSHFSSSNRFDPSLRFSGEYTYEPKLEWCGSSLPLKLRSVFFLQEDLFGTNPSRELSPTEAQLKFYGYVASELRSGTHCLLMNKFPLPPAASDSDLEQILCTLTSSDLEFHSVTGSIQARESYINQRLGGF